MLRVAGLAALLMLAGCERTPYPEMVTTEADTPTFAPEPPPRPPRPVPTATNNGRRVVIDEGTFSWESSYPAAVGAIPVLRRDFDELIDEGLSADRNLTRSVWTSQRNSGRKMTPQNYTYRYEVAADLPGWLSLSYRYWIGPNSATNDPQSGGSLWDKAASRSVGTLDLFVSKQKLACAVAEPVLAQIERNPAQRKQFDWRREDKHGKTFAELCFVPHDFGVILGSHGGRQFDRMAVMIQPLHIGEGDNYRMAHAIEVTLPVTEAVLQAVKPEYRAAFSIAR